MTRRSVTASAPGKIILSGEHFVVHGSYSVAAAINKRVLATVQEIDGSRSRIVSNDLVSHLGSDDGTFLGVKSIARSIISNVPRKNRESFEISIRSEIPSGAGLGSSAAVNVACAAALTKFVGLSSKEEEIQKLAFDGERILHGNPSGLDVQASISGGLILFKKGTLIEKIHLERPFKLLVVFSGKKRRTSKLVAKVAKIRERYPNHFQRLVDSSSASSFEIALAAKTRNMEKIGSIFEIAQANLSWIGVSTPHLESLIEFLYQKQEVLGAKLTGAGGGGSVIAVIKEGSEEPILRHASGSYPFGFVTEIPEEGFRWEK